MINNIVKKSVSAALAASMLAVALYAAVEPTITSAQGGGPGTGPYSDQVTISLTVESQITLTNGADITMSPNLTLANDQAVGSTSWTVTTNDESGYTLTVTASTSPALVSGGNSFMDFTQAATGTPETWSVASTDKEFGYSALGTDVSTGTWGTDSDCIAAAGVPSGGLKYHGFQTSARQIATRATVTPGAGIETTLCVAAEKGDDIEVPSGVYSAIISATATTL
jgi:hypothetical protein